MTRSASNMTLKLVLLHDELKNVNHVVLCGSLVKSKFKSYSIGPGSKSWSRNMFNKTLYLNNPPPTYIRQIADKLINKWQKIFMDCLCSEKLKIKKLK